MSSEKIELSGNDLNLDFLADTSPEVIRYKGTYKVIIADDDREVHAITKMMLKSFTFEGRDLTFIDTYSGKETIDALTQNPDTAVLFLDVVMEENNAGLRVVEYLRNTLKNSMTRIILRTGQPGEAPEDKVIRDYDINDYRLKTEMTVQRLNTSLYSALRSYRDIMQLERNRRGLKKMIQASSEMFRHNSMAEFLASVLKQISGFYSDDLELVFVSEAENTPCGFICADDKTDFTILAAKGKYEKYVNKNLGAIHELSTIYHQIIDDMDSRSRVTMVDNGFIIKQSGSSMIKNFIFVESDKNQFELDLLNLFLTNYSVALDNFYLNKLTSETQIEMIYTLGEVVEAQFEETSGHLKRITNLMYLLAQKAGFSDTMAEFVKYASALHDIGKIGIPNEILKKPGKLTDEEMTVMKTHSRIGHKILAKSNMEIFQIAADIALHHHEKFDGTGYPDGLAGEEISVCSRLMAIVDVFDAMTHKRIYKDALSIAETKEFLIAQKGKHFDPALVDLFIANLDSFIKDGVIRNPA